MDRLDLYGHVHGRPKQLMSSLYTWAKEAPTEGDFTAHTLVEKFARAFTPIRFVFTTNVGEENELVSKYEFD
jgi:hypothetical protein